MKSIIIKLFAVIFIAVLAVGCSSSLTGPVQKVEKEKEVVKQDDPKPDVARGESDMQASRPRPDF